MQPDPLALIREEIKVTMRSAGVSEAALSRDALIPRSTLGRKLGGASEFTLSELIRIARVLHVDAAQFVAAGSDAA